MNVQPHTLCMAMCYLGTCIVIVWLTGLLELLGSLEAGRTTTNMKGSGVGSSWQSSTSGSCVFLDMAVAHDWQKIGIGLHCVCVATALWLQLFVGQGVQAQWVGFIQIVLLEN